MKLLTSIATGVFMTMMSCLEIHSFWRTNGLKPVANLPCAPGQRQWWKPWPGGGWWAHHPISSALASWLRTGMKFIKVFIRGRESRGYLSDQGGWALGHTQAQAFGTLAAASERCRQDNLQGVDLVVMRQGIPMLVMPPPVARNRIVIGAKRVEMSVLECLNYRREADIRR